MKIIKEIPDLIILKQNNILAFFAGMIMVLVGFLIISKPSFFTGQAPLWLGLIIIVSGVVVIFLANITTTILDKNEKKLVFRRKTLTNEKIKEYDLASIKQIISQEIHGISRGGGQRYSYYLFFVLDNGERIPFFVSQANIMRKTAAKKAKILGEKIATFLNVPFEERGTPTVNELLSNIYSIYSSIQNATQRETEKNKKGFTPIQIILSILTGTIILGGIVGGVLYFAKSELPEEQQNQVQDQGFCGDGVCQDVEKERGVCEDCKGSQEQQSTTPTTPTPTPVTNQQTQTSYGDNGTDADGFLWGTEVWLDSDKIDASYKSAINDNLKTKNVRIRLGIANVSSDYKTFSTTACFPSFKDCSKKKIDLDDIVKKFKSNGWSMMPMLSYGYHGATESFSSSDIEKYVNFVDWFVSRYKNDANIKYVELENCPNCNLSLTVSKELLLEATNKIYDKVKGKYPDIMMGTPGFEYWIDEQNAKMVTMIDYFLDKNNGAKFDYWAFHGYQLSMRGNNMITTVPPTKSPSYNKYAGAKGILEIRKKFDANGWQNRIIIDTENGTIFPGIPYTTDEEKTDTAYYVQNDLIRRTQRLNDKFVLAGKITLKTRTRENLSGVTGDATAGDLNSSGSLYRSYKAISFLLSKLNTYNYSSHISGDWDAENTPWIEKFTSGSNKELYIFFKPFKYVSGKSISLDNETLNYTLNLTKTPKSITLTDIDGNASNVTASKTVTLQAVNEPKYLEVGY